MGSALAFELKSLQLVVVVVVGAAAVVAAATVVAVAVAVTVTVALTAALRIIEWRSVLRHPVGVALVSYLPIVEAA